MANKYHSVLVVDDSEAEQVMIKQIITSEPFCDQLNVYADARKALDFIKATPVDQLPEIIFLDIVMPEMDGFQFLNEFEKLSESVRQKCKIVLLSSSDSFKDLNRANKCRYVRRFLNKPLTNSMLQAINF
ncbi:MAG: response regulator [Bacteroidetes bacterium]|jgi:CheY-like chemotaxis protein|nr:response regulator [Bacteroidota bacterium]HMU78315.1 response regulator [Bacteroidia bacterium]MCW5919073.1 response regulator [Bacteroidota bacterium]HCI57266.1 hypothetical protein [Bacteroidota bacterium]HMW11024.1 response regulator [Bacteroidia bacterium]